MTSAPISAISVSDVVSIALKAGKAILPLYEDQKESDVTSKADGSPLTQADTLSNEIIVSSLQKLYPAIPILSEEQKEIPYDERKEWKQFWLVDPLDGTKEFVNKNDEFTINIALVTDGVPTLGVIYVPVLDVCYYADGHGAYLQDSHGNTTDLLSAPLDKDHAVLRVIASRSHFSGETKEYIEGLNRSYELISAGSSVKFCRIAEGKADIYPRLAPTMEWDTAAGHAIAVAVGKKVYKFGTTDPLQYNKEDLTNPWFIVQ